VAIDKPILPREIGQWSLVALMVNFTIGAGIFGLPAAAAAILGQQSPIAYLFAAAEIGVIAACVAEVASRFHQAGGPYLYARATFGPFLGLQTGWLLWLSRVSSAAAVASVFVDYLPSFWPQAKNPITRLVILTILVSGLAIINIRGVNAGTRLSNVLTIAKLLPLLILVIGGVLYLYLHGSPVAVVTASHPVGAWLRTVLLLVYAFTGFESALIPGGELKHARRDIPRATLVALLLIAIVYFLVQVVVVRLLSNPAQSDHPLSAAGFALGGNAIGAIVAFGALLSSVGNLSANMIASPRLTFAFAEQGDFPGFFGSIHRRYRTPYISIMVFAILLWALALMGTFRWNAILSALSRLFAYGITCAALPILRKKDPAQQSFRLPGGTAFAALGIVFALVLLSRMGRAELIALTVTAALSFLNWLAVRWRDRNPQTRRPWECR
jgi:amino acid transporter